MHSGWTAALWPGARLHVLGSAQWRVILDNCTASCIAVSLNKLLHSVDEILVISVFHRTQ